MNDFNDVAASVDPFAIPPNRIDRSPVKELNATFYFHMGGKYIRMERPASQAETELDGCLMVGMAAHVVRIEQDCFVVRFTGDDGNTFVVTAEDADQWTFFVWPNEAAMKAWVVEVYGITEDT